MATIKDVAELSQVSASTVSRVLNNDKSISVQEETRQRIFQAAKELQYKTIHERRGEQQKKEEKKDQSGKSFTKIGVVLCQSIEEELNDPFFLTIRHGIEEELYEHDINTTKIIRLDERNQMMLEGLDGLIIVGRLNDRYLKSVCSQVNNIVYVNHSPDEDLYDSVVIDFVKATNKALRHLLKAGHKQIGYIGGVEKEHLKDQTQVIEDLRLTTYEQIMKEEGLFNAENIFIGEYSMTDGYELMKKALQLKKRPGAFFISSDPMAIGALKAVQEAKLSVPDDVAIVGFDDIDMAEFASTPLTTVKVYTKEMGKAAVKLLFDRIRGRKLPLKITVPTELVIRESSKTNHSADL